MNQQQKDRIAGTPLLWRLLLERVYEGKASPRMAIKAFCLQCTGCVRQDITDCTANACPLHAYRPYQQSTEEDE